MAEKESISIQGINKILNKNSGLKGISEISSGDDREILAAEGSGNERADIYINFELTIILQF